jgi:thiol-disulfide isomerase/thioredoxin
MGGTGTAPPALDFVLLGSDAVVSLDKLRDGKVLVLGENTATRTLEVTDVFLLTSICPLSNMRVRPADLWTTRCTNCPAALDKLQKMAEKYAANGNVVFASVNCDDKELAAEMVDER